MSETSYCLIALIIKSGVGAFAGGKGAPLHSGEESPRPGRIMCGIQSFGLRVFEKEKDG